MLVIKHGTAPHQHRPPASPRGRPTTEGVVLLGGAGFGARGRVLCGWPRNGGRGGPPVFISRRRRPSPSAHFRLRTAAACSQCPAGCRSCCAHVYVHAHIRAHADVHVRGHVHVHTHVHVRVHIHGPWPWPGTADINTMTAQHGHMIGTRSSCAMGLANGICLVISDLASFASNHVMPKRVIGTHVIAMGNTDGC